MYNNYMIPGTWLNTPTKNIQQTIKRRTKTSHAFLSAYFPHEVLAKSIATSDSNNDSIKQG